MAFYPLRSLNISDETALIVFITIQCIYLLLSSWTIIQARKLWKLHQEHVQFVSKRTPQLIMFGVFLLNLYPLLIRPLTDLPTFWRPLAPLHNFYLRLGLVDVIHLYLYALFARVWLLYYQFERGRQTVTVQWKKYIRKQADYTPWTLKYKYFGCSYRVFVVSIVCWILSMIVIQSGCYLYNGDKVVFSFRWRSIVISPMIVGAIFIAFKMRRWIDTFHIKRELQLICIACGIVFLLFCILSVFTERDWNIHVILSNVLLCGWCYALALISTQWVIHKYKQRQTASVSDKQLPLKDILSTKKGFKLFADYLVKEFSIEHLFFLFEMMKLKNELVASHIVNRREVGIPIVMKYDDKSADKLIAPKASIKEFKADLWSIIDRYIEPESDCSINISARTRSSILKEAPLLLEERVSSSYLAVSSVDHDHDQMQIPVQVVSPTETDEVHDDDHERVLEKEQEQSSRVHTNSNGALITDFERFILEYLKKMDVAIEEVWKLLECDSLSRFYESDEYQHLVKATKEWKGVQEVIDVELLQTS